MLRPLLQSATQRLKTAKWQLAAALVASTIPAFAQAQTKLDILVNHDAFPLQTGGGSIDSSASVNGPVGGHFAYRAKVKINGASAAVKNVTLTQLLPAGAIFQGVGTVPEGKTTGEPVLPAGVACSNLPATGTLLGRC